MKQEKILEIRPSLEKESQPISDKMSCQIFSDQSRYYKRLVKRRRMHDIDQGSSSNDTSLHIELESTSLQSQLAKSHLQSIKSELQTIEDQLKNIKDQVKTSEDRLVDVETTRSEIMVVLAELEPHRFRSSKS